MALDTKLCYSNLTIEEKEALKSLRDDTSIIIKEADKGSAVVIWDCKDYLIEAENQLLDSAVYEELKGDYISPLIKKVKYCLNKIKLRGDICQEMRTGRFYMLPKIHKGLNSVPGRPVISNCVYFTESISSFVDHYLQPLSKWFRSFT